MTMSRTRFIAAATVPFVFAVMPLVALAAMLASPSGPNQGGEAVTVIIDTRGLDAMGQPERAMSYSGQTDNCYRDIAPGIDS
jgi:hypothetical protein